MQISIVFKNVKSTDELKNYLEKKINKLDKLLDNKGIVRVVLTMKDIRYLVEIQLDAGKIHINTQEEAKEKNLNTVIDKAINNIKVQLLKIKEKQKR